ncbi:hydantoinase B/oxoprolinase family protein [Neiella marina]|uniref:Hydantoinase B/oxoprolinase family protein n=1 Tax=Neiella holothuriorum TaxID=2870530 RepID=A0ABS7ECK6_9GAMM|nr:hydantoinase B/oxoprolinase family protein [Neiella holothuriorum]MBW8190062.1 hydantoinase B/oxoprolinase family protein [Neiella holothuriorum]
MADWQLWIDRGGTFTDLVGQAPDGQLHVHILLSEHPEQYQDAVTEGVRRLLHQHGHPDDGIDVVKMGTTVATNALLERKGDAVALVITKGFADALLIGYQHRKHLFERRVTKPDALYQHVIEADERMADSGAVLRPLAQDVLRQQLQSAFQQGFRACAIAFIHSYKYPEHELQAAAIAADIGFEQISLSHQASALIKLVGRADTCVVDAYLSPVLRRYVEQVRQGLRGANLQMMQSHGGLTDAAQFAGKDAILSGPAGGVVSMVETARQAGFERIIGFDMGGTSTDVSLFAGEYERCFETEVAGVRLRAPMMNIHTVAAGGGSVLEFDGQRMQVGPDSAGADPGPRCYRKGGPLAVTDINVLLGKLQADFFPSVFGDQGDQPLDTVAVSDAFLALQRHLAKQGINKSSAEIASGFLQIAVNHMANAIKTISVQRGHPANDFVLSCFGGAGPQHACLVADELAIDTIIIHPLSGVLSAYGMGLASIRELANQSLEINLDSTGVTAAEQCLGRLQQQAQQTVLAQLSDASKAPSLICKRQLALRYQGSDTSINVAWTDVAGMTKAFEQAHQNLFGFCQPDVSLMIASALVEVIAEQAPETPLANPQCAKQTSMPEALTYREVYSAGRWQKTPFWRREQLQFGHIIDGPAIVLDETTTIVIEPGWQASIDALNNMIVKRVEARAQHMQIGEQVDPVMLEVFNNLFMHIATHMGHVLQQTAASVNIKERLDFSCAVFDKHGKLVANAPHMPVHLGSMGETVEAVLNRFTPQQGASYLVNSPYHGGTHLPDLTVVTPVFNDQNELIFVVASRGHHADIGGITPGSMPAHSRDLAEEGICFECFELVKHGEFQQQALLEHLLQGGGDRAARNPEQNIADLKAQLAANQKGVSELIKVLDYFGLATVEAYMQHVQNYAEDCVRRAVSQLSGGSYCYPMDNGNQIQVAITVDAELGTATIDFTGTSPQGGDNYNAPKAVTMAAILYVFRCLVDDDIPLNAGCLKPLNIIIPEGSILAPQTPAAVVAGNVETSQCICNALFAAMGVMAAGQGTMNNLIFGDADYQYYETICGGSGAGLHGDGTDAIHCHMTNSRLTDVEVLEHRFPVQLESFKVRKGSGGAGKFKGGDGVVRRLKFLKEMDVSLLSNHRQSGAPGVAGGHPGAPGINRLIAANGNTTNLPYAAQVTLAKGDSIELETPGGGGFGVASDELRNDSDSDGKR